MMKIGIFGSSFNPLHIGHLAMVDQAIERLYLDKLLLVPTKNPYHKQVDLLDFEDRLSLCRIEAEVNRKLEISDIEARIEGPSYTYDVINKLKELYPESDFYFIMGSDSLINFHSWYRYEELIKMATYVIFKRPEDPDIKDKLSEYRKLGMDIYYYDDLQMQISSTFIRESLREGKSVRYLLTDRSLKYIKENGYYE